MAYSTLLRAARKNRSVAKALAGGIGLILLGLLLLALNVGIFLLGVWSVYWGISETVANGPEFLPILGIVAGVVILVSYIGRAARK